MSKDTGYYDVLERSDFRILFTPCKDVTKLSNSFITAEQLKAYRIGDCPWNVAKEYKNKVEPHNLSIAWNYPLIREIVEEWAELIAEDGYSTTRKTLRSRRLLAEVPNHIIHDALRTVKWELSNGRVQDGPRVARRRAQREQEREQEYQKRKEEQRKQDALRPYVRPDTIQPLDHHMLAKAVYHIVCSTYDLNISRYSYHKMILLGKRTLSWNEVKRGLKIYLPEKQWRLDIAVCKKLWDSTKTPAKEA